MVMIVMGSLEEEEACNTGLGLSLGMGEYVPRSSSDHNKHKKKQHQQPAVRLELSFPLHSAKDDSLVIEEGKAEPEESNDNDRNNNNNNNDSNNIISGENSGRKKLRLTKDQTTLLEESFKLHSTLNLAQKESLAHQLHLKPRQVEVWFQNRRARTKLKQTEVDCEFLKKCCENLSNENKRLKREVNELRTLKLVGQSSAPFYIQIPKATTIAMCPCCEKMYKPEASSQGQGGLVKSGGAAVVEVVRKPNKLEEGF